LQSANGGYPPLAAQYMFAYAQNILSFFTHYGLSDH
jgi:hypothetical protein